MKTIVLNGSSGFLGSQISNFLKGKYTIITLKRNEYLLPPERLALIIDGCDYIINIAGAPIFSLWTKKNRNTIYSSRIDCTKNLVNALAYVKKKPELFLSASGVNIYNNGSYHTEQSKDFSSGFLGNVCLNWENEAFKAKNCSVPVAIFRTGVVLSPHNGFLKYLSKTIPLKFIINFGSGKQSFPWISLQDYLLGLLFILEGNYSGIYNFVAPESITQKYFNSIFKQMAKCWFTIQVPHFLLSFLPGNQKELLLENPEVYPEALLNIGFTFYDTSLANTSLI